MRREDVLLNLRATGLERQADGDWEKPDVDWPELTSEWSRERGLVADYIFQKYNIFLIPYALPDSIKRWNRVPSLLQSLSLETTLMNTMQVSDATWLLMHHEGQPGSCLARCLRTLTSDPASVL